MSVLTCRDATCVVALFFDDRQLKPTDPETERSLRAYLEAVKQDFVAAFKSKVESVRPTLKDIADGKNQVSLTKWEAPCLLLRCNTTYCRLYLSVSLRDNDVTLLR